MAATTTPYDQAVEQACAADRSAAAVPGARLLTIGALFLLPLVAFLDGVVSPPEIALVHVWRGVAFAVCALLLCALHTDVGRRRALACGIATVLAFGTNVELLAADGTVGTHCHAIVIVALLGGWLALPWRPAQVLTVAAVLVAFYAAGSMLLVGTRDQAQLLGHLAIMIGAAGVVAAAAAVRERERRQLCSRRVDLEAYARRQEAIASIGQLGFRTRDAQVLLERAVVWVGEALGTSQGAVWSVSYDQKTLLLTAGVGWDDGAVGQATLDANGRSHPAAVLRAGEPVVVGDFRKEKRMECVGVLRDRGIVSGIGVVVKVRERACALLTAYASTRRDFSRDDIEFLRAAARLLGRALSEYRAEEVSKQDAQASGALARAGRELLASLDPAVLLERLCALTRDIVGCEQSSTWFTRGGRELLEATTAVGVSDESWQAMLRAPFEVEAVGQTLARLAREEVLQVRPDDGAEPFGDLLRAHGISNGLLVVLRRDGDPVGVQLLGRTSGRAFTSQEQRVAQGIAQLAGMALTNAHLVEQMTASALREGSDPTASGRAAAPALPAQPDADGADRVAAGVRMAALPRRTDDQYLAATRANVAEVQHLVSNTRPPKRKKLLFADDLGMARLLLRRYLEREMPQVELLEAFDGGQAFAMFETHRPDLVILDLQMPDVDGYEAARRIRALDGAADVPIIATSITTGPRVEFDALAAGFTEFVAKPVSDYGPLRARIDHWLDDERRPVPPLRISTTGASAALLS